MQKEAFINFLKETFPDKHPELIKSFESYFNWIIEENRKINLISRQTDPEDIWTQHFLDSLLSVKHVNYSGKAILDFGTGGGLPGIPLAIAYPNASVTLLDSRKKKDSGTQIGCKCFTPDKLLFSGHKNRRGTGQAVSHIRYNSLPIGQDTS